MLIHKCKVFKNRIDLIWRVFCPVCNEYIDHPFALRDWETALDLARIHRLLNMPPTIKEFKSYRWYPR